MLAGFFVAGGAANSGWTSYPPLSVLATRGQDFWLVGILLLGLSSMLNAMNVITTIVQLRAPGLTFMRLPFFVWAQLLAALLLLLAFPPLQTAAAVPADGPGRRHQLLPAERAGGQRLVAAGTGRRRQPDAVAAPVLVPRPSRGLRADPPGHRHRRRDHGGQHPAAAVGVSAPWSRRCCSSAGCRSSSGHITCFSPAWARRSGCSSRSRR